MHSIKHSYLDGAKKIRACGSEDVLESLPHRKQDRPLLLGDKIDSMVQAYTKSTWTRRCCVYSNCYRRYLRDHVHLNKTKLKEYDGLVDLNRYWAITLFATYGSHIK